MEVLMLSLLMLFSPFTVGVDYFQALACCTFDGPGWDHMEYTVAHYYNKKLVMLYNGTSGNYTGYTEYGIYRAHRYQTDPYEESLKKIGHDLMCKDNIDRVEDLNKLMVAPTVRLTGVTQPSMLLCSAYDFYPKHIRVKWLQNGQEVVYSTEAIPSGDWYYQIHSYLDYSPSSGDSISCVVEHVSLREPLIQVWEPSPPKSQRTIDAVGTSFMVLGLVSVICGLIYYKRMSAGPLSRCREREMVPVEIVPVAGAQ